MKIVIKDATGSTGLEIKTRIPFPVDSGFPPPVTCSSSKIREVTLASDWHWLLHYQSRIYIMKHRKKQDFMSGILTMMHGDSSLVNVSVPETFPDGNTIETARGHFGDVFPVPASASVPFLSRGEMCCATFPGTGLLMSIYWASYRSSSCESDGSWTESTQFSGCGWVWRDSGGNIQLLGTRNFNRLESALHSEVEALRWEMENMLQHSTCQSFGAYCKELIAMIKEPHA
ncbi:hypothetical protein F2Q69_00029611 [Brassica cretica]|uniref:RNase H type-1 domain-containing protein n=1 Tax=Brassica cretica TaxID=69181 RepID=A0A8S9S3G0_BRACR|nr:hypothetical protein F2Q69_00029611 [Brassica cretica]